jgi:glucan phosphoethanolaminetransferase (alkaline phosphatase superfamily)
VGTLLAAFFDENFHEEAVMTPQFFWSLLVMIWALAVLVLLSRCSYYLKHLLAEKKKSRQD